jgi:hypothetical protein
MTLVEIATRLNAHLKRLEKSGVWAELDQPGAYYLGGARIRLTYISRDGGTTLSRSKAVAYLALLDAGHIGRHTDHLEPNRFATTASLDSNKAKRKQAHAAYSIGTFKP